MISASLRRPSQARLFLLVLSTFAMLAAVIVAGSGSARAQAPLRLPDNVVDTAGVFSAPDHDAIATAIDSLYDSRTIQMWVVYVDSFNGMSSDDWAKQTEALSNLGNGDVILAVSTKDGAYKLTSAKPIDGLTQAELTDIGNNTLKPELAKGQWTTSAVETIEAIDSAAANDSASAATIAAWIVGAAVVGGGLVFFFLRRRKRDAGSSDSDALTQQTDSLSVDQLSEQPLDVLQAWSREILNDTDNALKTSADELTLAIAEFGEASTAPFTAAMNAAQEGLSESFALRQRLDDNTSATDDEQRAMLVQIITACSDADSLLDEQVSAFDALRNLVTNAEDRLTELSGRITETSARLPRSEATLDDLTSRYGGTVIVSIADNLALAREQLQFAEASVEQGREAIAQPAGQQGPVAADIRSAESANDAATKLLDAIDSADETIARAASGRSLLVDALDATITEADSLDDKPTDLATALDKARAALDAAKTDGESDPVGTVAALTDAAAGLDAALTAARGTSEEPARQATLVTNALETAEAKTQAAADFIETRRGAIGSIARTRLSRAQNLGSQAVDLANADPATALNKARRAATHADEALTQAQADVVAWHEQQRTPAHVGADGAISTAGVDTSAVLSGILVDSVLRGSVRPLEGGYNTGGRSPGSFGGSASSGRIGTGGRL